ncbi:hypothetical protein [Streptomyces sp. NPDC004546]|uniref:hypothetical protein n=1 Tax=Streptomyces sp. NPDC004546 TaxID=3154282 RepID=UPI0033B3DF35
MTARQNTADAAETQRHERLRLVAGADRAAATSDDRASTTHTMHVTERVKALPPSEAGGTADLAPPATE